MILLLLLLLPGVRSQEGTSPRPLFNAVQFVPHKNAKKGPILFPNDAPPPPPTPLIVTSRPLSESIARSELNPNNTLTAQSQFHQVSFKPEFLARNKNYKPFTYNVATATPVYDYGLSKLGYENPSGGQRDNFYDDYEKHWMEPIHPKRESLHRRKTYPWERPLRQRRYEQDYGPRKTIHDNEVKSREIRYYHSPYSREFYYYEDGDHRIHHAAEHSLEALENDMDYMDTRRKSNVEDRRRILYRRPQYHHHYHYRRRNINRRDHPHIAGDRDVLARPIRDPDKVKTYDIQERNKSNNTVDTTRNFIEYKDRILRRSQSYEHLSRNNDKLGGNSLEFSKTNPDKYGRNFRRMPSGNPQPLRIRPVLSIENKISHYGKLRPQDSMYNLRGSREYRGKVPNRNVWQRLADTDNEEIFLRRRPSHSPEQQSSEKLKDLPKIKSMESIDFLDNILSEKKPQNSEKVEITSPRILEMLRQTEAHTERIPKKPFYNPETGEMLQQRNVQPLYGVTGDGHQNRYSSPQTNSKYKESPHHYNNYPTNEGDHDHSKEFNHGENYAFSYTVKDHKTGDDFSHSQQSTGSATNGEYRVRLPDGRMQIVSYTADENGYKADVRYDEQHNQDNSIDIDVSKENQYKTHNLPTTYKHTNPPYNDHAVDTDSLENEEYIRQHLRNNKGINIPELPKPTAYSNPLNDIYGNHDKNFETINDYANKNDYQPYNYQTKSAYVDATKVSINDNGSGGLTDNNNEYLEHYNEKFIERNDKAPKTKDDDYFKFSQELPSKELMDYSSELNDPYQPHKSKFSAFGNQDSKTNVVPSYDDLKDLFVTNPNGRRNSPSIATTARPLYDVTPVEVVEITPKKTNLYTNIKNIVTPLPYSFSTVSPTTPKSYLVSTIANLKHQINLASKPVLSHQFINKINKYLSYK
ncbi:hypothetical protein B5X24_HaOG209353 [Helicoverpa armigera]|nr:hypothetical protein B5X24_HaOG209353 [Helicoverpa armigera]